MRSNFIVVSLVHFNLIWFGNFDERSISDRTICSKRVQRLIAYHRVVMWSLQTDELCCNEDEKERKIRIDGTEWNPFQKLVESTIHPNMCHSVWRTFACWARRACDAVLLRYVLGRSVHATSSFESTRVGELDDLQIVTLQNNIKYFVIHDVIGGSFDLASV